MGNQETAHTITAHPIYTGVDSCTRAHTMLQDTHEHNHTGTKPFYSHALMQNPRCPTGTRTLSPASTQVHACVHVPLRGEPGAAPSSLENLIDTTSGVTQPMLDGVGAMTGLLWGPMPPLVKEARWAPPLAPPSMLQSPGPPAPAS